MALAQQREFLSQIPPFDHLPENLLYQLADSMNVVYLPDKTHLYADEMNEQDALYILIKGKVAEKEEGNIISRYSVRGFFGDAEILGRADAQVYYEVQEEAIAYCLPEKYFMKAFQESHDFAQFFNASIVEKLNRIHDALQSATSTEVMMDTVCSAPLHEVISVREQATVLEVIQTMTNAGSNTCLVQLKDGDTGIVTS